MKDRSFERLKDQLGNEIKELRQLAGLSQEALALTANVDRTYISQLERGIANPSLKILCRICNILGAEVHNPLLVSTSKRKAGNTKPNKLIS